MNLGEPLALPCGARLRNRIAKAAMSENLADADHGPSAGLRALYARWGESGAGLLITGNMMIDARHLGEPGDVVIDREEHLDRLTAWVTAARRGGAAVWAQINHPGRQAPRALTPVPMAPSSVALSTLGLFGRPRAMAQGDIDEVIERFADGADRARRAGFDGVQIHAAHGYLLSQFLSPRTNQRSDDWGGTLVARARLLLAVVGAVRARVGPRFPVGVKLNSADFQRGGFTSEEAVEVACWLADAGVDLLELSGGNYEEPAMMRGERASTGARGAYFQGYAARVREASAVPLMVTGGFRSRAGMSAALDSGAVDVIGLARPFAVDPRVAARILAGELESLEVPTPRVGLRRADDILAVVWFQAQLARAAAGGEPDLHLGRWRTLFAKFREARRPRRG